MTQKCWLSILTQNENPQSNGGDVSSGNKEKQEGDDDKHVHIEEAPSGISENDQVVFCRFKSMSTRDLHIWQIDENDEVISPRP